MQFWYLAVMNLIRRESGGIFDQFHFIVVLKGRCRALFSSLLLCYRHITASELCPVRGDVNGRKYLVPIVHTNAKERLVISSNINLCVLMYCNLLSDRSNVKTQICYLFAILKRNLLSCSALMCSIFH